MSGKEWPFSCTPEQVASDEEIDAFLAENLADASAFIDELDAQVHWVPAKKQDGPIVPATL